MASIVIASIIVATADISCCLGEEPVSLFNGKDLSGWKGRSDLWSVEDGAITGRTTEANPIKENTFLVSEREVSNFDLTFEYRIENGNSGVQYRSELKDQESSLSGDIRLTSIRSQDTLESTTKSVGGVFLLTEVK